MAPLDGTHITRGHQLQQSLDCGHKTLALVQARAEVPASYDTDLRAAIAKLLYPQSNTLTVHKASELDKLGSNIWNAAATLTHDEEYRATPAIGQISTGRLVVLLRVLAYLLVDTAHQSAPSRRKVKDQQVRIFRVALRACRTCLDQGELGFAYDMLQRAAGLVAKIEASTAVAQLAEDDDTARQHVLSNMVGEYNLLRIAHAWKSDRLDLVDHFYAQLDFSGLTANADLGDKAAGLFHQMARAMLVQTLYHDAAKWSDRSLSLLNACDVADLGPDTPDLRLATTSTSVDSLIGVNDVESREKAVLLVEQLDSKHGLGNRVATHLLQFNLLISDAVLNAPMIEKTILRMIATALLTEKMLKLLLHVLHRAQNAKLPCTLTAMDNLIIKRLIPDLDNGGDIHSPSWNRLEKVLVMFIMFATSEPCQTAQTTPNVQHVLDTVLRHGKRVFSAKATHAAQTLMWKAMGPSLEPNRSSEWCLLLRHPLFASAGQINKGRIWRKALQLALNENNLEAAREVYFSMPKEVREESLTQYLCFKLALRSQDEDLACKSLDLVARCVHEDPSMLFACVLDAQQSSMRRMATIALLKILDHRPPEVHIPSLLRCTVRLLMGELVARDRDLNGIMTEILHVFETAAANTQSLRQGTDEQWNAETQWWSKNAYNLAVRFCAEMNPEHLVNFLQVCTKFIDCRTANDVGADQRDCRRRKMLCKFLSASALVVLARAKTEDAEQSLQCYLRARQEIVIFQTLFSEHGDDATSDVDDGDYDHKTMLARAFELHKFELEAILHLQQWGQLDASLHSMLQFPGSDCWESAIDLLFTLHAQATAAHVQPSFTARIPDMLQKCTNESWRKDKDIHKMSRWLRLIFTLHLDAANASSHTFALKILSQAASIAKRGYEGRNEAYPADELAWLAAMAFNKGVDLLVLEDEQGADAWMVEALELARYADDAGRLHASLTTSKRMADERRRTHAVASGTLR